MWGLLLHDRDVESNERTFVVVFVLAGVMIFLMSLAFVECVVPFLIIAPIAEFFCYSMASRMKGGTAHTASSSAVRVYAREGKDFVRLLLRTCIAITLVSFVWEMYATSVPELVIPKFTLFGIGLILSALMIFLFTCYSSSVGFVAAARWVLPIMAIGLFLSDLQQPIAFTLACVLLAGSHASLETILRMQVIGFAQKSAYDPMHVIGWGFAAIMAGAFLGPALYCLIVPVSLSPNPFLITGVLTVLVILSAFLFTQDERREPPARNDGMQSLDIDERSARMSLLYGLSIREHEILGYLLAGRSHPYIRDALYVSKSTVDTHVRHIYAKTGVRSKQDLIDLSMR